MKHNDSIRECTFVARELGMYSIAVVQLGVSEKQAEYALGYLSPPQQPLGYQHILTQKNWTVRGPTSRLAGSEIQHKAFELIKALFQQDLASSELSEEEKQQVFLAALRRPRSRLVVNRSVAMSWGTILQAARQNHTIQ